MNFLQVWPESSSVKAVNLGEKFMTIMETVNFY